MTVGRFMVTRASSHPSALRRVRPEPARATLGVMALRVVVYPPDGQGGRRVRVDGAILGTAYSLRDLAVFLERAGLEGWDELDVAAAQGLIEWRGGGPDVWER